MPNFVSLPGFRDFYPADLATSKMLPYYASKFRTVEINYSDDPDDPHITDENRRRGQLAWLLRASTLVDVDCWTRVLGEPRIGAHGTLIFFVHPKDMGGVLTEIMESPKQPH
mgnify:CR=1 FL=1